MVLLLCLCILLHELGHALIACRLGLPVRAIQLTPLGGLAVFEKPISRPRDELLIALAGPVVNLLIAIGLGAVAFASGLLVGLDRAQLAATTGAPSLAGALLWLIQANLLLTLLNLIPAFPLDGGRMLRACLTLLGERRCATLLVVAVGQFLAVILGAWSLLSLNLLLLFSAVVIFVCARHELAPAEEPSELSQLRVGEVYVCNDSGLQIGQRLHEAAILMQAGDTMALPVWQGSRLIGVVTREQAQQAMAQGRGDIWVTAAMRRELVRVQASDSLTLARCAMVDQGTPVAAVFTGAEYLGLLTSYELAAAERDAASIGRRAVGTAD
jgi:Zn-dependent protease